MKEVKELADLVAMHPRERDAWFAERFGYGTRHEIICGDIKHCAHLKKDGHEVCFPTFTQFAAGCADLKAEMVKLGYVWESCYVDDGNTTFYKTEFHHKEKDSYGIAAEDNEIEATWKAAALALLGGE